MAEAGQDDLAVRAHQDPRGADVTVDDARAVGGVENGEELEADAGGTDRIQPAAPVEFHT
nr:hypothetical protein [Streptomyces sp. RTd22]